MIRNLFTLLVVGSLGYWYYTGPLQNQINPSKASQLKDNAKKMELCLRGEDYVRNATGKGSTDATERCARRHKLFMADGAWHSLEQ